MPFAVLLDIPCTAFQIGVRDKGVKPGQQDWSSYGDFACLESPEDSKSVAALIGITDTGGHYQ